MEKVLVESTHRTRNIEQQLQAIELGSKYARRSETMLNPTIRQCSLSFFSSLGGLNQSTGPQVPLSDVRQLPLAVLARRSRTFGTHTTVDDTSVALPVAIRSVVVRVSVGCTCTRLEKAGSGSVRNALLWVVADRAGTLVAAGVAVVEEFLWRVSVCR